MINNRNVAWAIWFIASIFYAYQYILRVIPNIMMPDIMAIFNIDAQIFGQFSGIYYIGYSLMHLPIGIALDRFGPKKVMPFFIALTTIGMLPLLYSNLWLYPVIGRLLVGIGSSAAILGLFKIIRIGFAEAKFTRMLSIAVTIGLVGAIYGGGPVNYLRTIFGFSYVIHGLLALGIVLAIISFIIIPPISQDSHSTGSIFRDLKEIATNYKLIIVCILAGLMVGPLEGFADVWGTEFLKKVYGFNSHSAASLPSLIFLGMCFGAPVLSFIAEKVKNFYAVITICAVVMSISFIAIMFGNLSVPMISILFVVIGVLCSYQIIAIYKVSTYVQEKSVGLATAVANMIIMIFGYIFHSSIGQIIKSASTAGSIHDYHASSFIYGIAIIPIALAISAVGFLILTITERKAYGTIRA